MIVIAIGLIFEGSSVAATYITTLVFMMNESIANGAPDTEQTRVMITSLWLMSQDIAGYLGRCCTTSLLDNAPNYQVGCGIQKRYVRK